MVVLMDWKPCVPSFGIKSVWIQWKLHLIRPQWSTSRMLHLIAKKSAWALVCFLLREEICTCLQTQTKLSQGFGSGGLCELNGPSLMILFCKTKQKMPERQKQKVAEGFTRWRRPLWWRGGWPSLCRTASASRFRPGWRFRSRQGSSRPRTSTYVWRPPPNPLDWPDLHGAGRPHTKRSFKTSHNIYHRNEGVCKCVLTCVNEYLRLGSRCHWSSVDCSRRQICPIDSVLFAVMGYTNNYGTLNTHTWT